MNKIVSLIAETVETAIRLARLDIGRDAKKRILKTYLRVVFLNKKESSKNTINLLGHEFSYCTREHFLLQFKEIFVNQDYRFHSDNPSPFIIDCGSNIGMSVLYFKTIYPGARIIGFEPDEDAFRCLERNVAGNGFASVQIHRKALAAGEGRVEFFGDPDFPGALANSCCGKEAGRMTREVETVRLSRYVDGDVDFLKMNIEGAELDVLEELRQAGQLQQVRQMAVEYHHHIDENEDSLSRFLRLLEDEGFGYQVESRPALPIQTRQLQCILVYAYRKNASV